MSNSPASEDLQALYRQNVLDHARNPRNFGRPKQTTHTAEGINPLCGDKLHIFLTVTADASEARVTGAHFEGSGCAISMASASLLTEHAAELTTQDAADLATALTNRLTGDSAAVTLASTDIDATDLRILDGVRQHPARVKCATLAWKTLLAALANESTATTE